MDPIEASTLGDFSETLGDFWDRERIGIGNGDGQRRSGTERSRLGDRPGDGALYVARAGHRRPLSLLSIGSFPLFVKRSTERPSSGRALFRTSFIIATIVFEAFGRLGDRP